MIAIDAVKRTMILVKKFGIYLCVPVFLMIAYSYTNSTYSKYRVTARISLRDVPAESAIAEIGSKSLVRKALAQLPFQASYYDSSSPRDEVFGSALPVRMVFDHPRSNDDEVWLNLEITGKNSFALTHGDTVAYHEFNEPVREWYGNFKVVHRPVVQYGQASYMVRLDDPAKMWDQYYDNLRVETAGDDEAVVSIVSGNPQKGIDFLNKLLQLYSAGKHPALHHNYAGSFTMLDKPENNIESAGIGSFWIYFIALLAGLAIPIGWSRINGQGIDTLPSWLISVSKMWRYTPRRVTAKQLGVKVARRFLFKEA